ncbi:MAG: hypothetical protein JNK87_34525 [Bryobacterales bacterium]|nr:hypothetical protein [Bryobacterales bacterium]
MSNMIIGPTIPGFRARKAQIPDVRAVMLSVWDLLINSLQPWAYLYTCSLNVDWDGAPDAYGLDRPGFPEQTGLTPRETFNHLVYARREADWSRYWAAIISLTRADAIAVLVKHKLIPKSETEKGGTLSSKSEGLLARYWDNRTTTQLGHSLENTAGDGKFPIVQIKELPTTIKKGYYVSTTSSRIPGFAREDPHAYPDASTIPYMVQPALPGVQMGDYALVIRNATGASVAVVCGDGTARAGGSKKLGECSGAVYLAVGKENEGDFSFLVFPGSSSGSVTDVAAASRAVRTQVAKLSADEADRLADQLAPRNAMGRFHVRTALTKWGAPQMIPPQVDAITGAGRRAP